MITTSSELANFCNKLHNQAWLAIDTEFVREKTYYAELSLIQICTQDGQLALIDPLCGLDLTSFWDILASDKIIKIFHSARQDIEVLFQLSNQMPQNIFDTQIAGFYSEMGDMAGLARTLETRLGVVLPKEQTRTNWHQRPLTPEQIEYALDDVRYLPELYSKIIAELNPHQTADLQSKFQQLLNPDLYHIQPDLAWQRIKGKNKLKSRGKAILRELAAWREEYAQQNNLPRPWVISDFGLVEISKRGCDSQDCLFKIKEIKPSSIRKHAAKILEIVARVKAEKQVEQEAKQLEQQAVSD